MPKSEQFDMNVNFRFRQTLLVMALLITFLKFKKLDMIEIVVLFF